MQTATSVNFPFVAVVNSCAELAELLGVRLVLRTAATVAATADGDVVATTAAGVGPQPWYYQQLSAIEIANQTSSHVLAPNVVQPSDYSTDAGAALLKSDAGTAASLNSDSKRSEHSAVSASSSTNSINSIVSNVSSSACSTSNVSSSRGSTTRASPASLCSNTTWLRGASTSVSSGEIERDRDAELGTNERSDA